MKKAQSRHHQQKHERAVARRREVSARRRLQPARIWQGGDVETIGVEATFCAYTAEFDRAFALLDELRRRFPTYPDLQSKRAYIRLLAGEVSPEVYRELRGGRDGRPRVQGLKAFDRAGIPLWQGEAIPGKRLLIWGWGGFGYGDVIQNFRMIPTAKAQSGAHLTLGCPTGLSRLFKGWSGVDAWVEPPLPTLEGIDYHCPAEWLVVTCPLTPAILQGCPYLFPEPELVEQWRPTFADRSVVHVGLHWIADAGHGNAQWRTMRLQDLAPLFDIPRVRWYSLQRGGAAEVAKYSEVVDLGDIDHPDAKFINTAAVLTHLDATVCIDSSIGHLSGALGRPVFVVLGVLADPQWGVDVSGKALWYPDTRVRQVQPRDLKDGTRPIGKDLKALSAWHGVVARLGDELDEDFIPHVLAQRGDGIG